MNEIVGDPEPSLEDHEKLLHDIRSVRDGYAEDRSRAENGLLTAQQMLHVMQVQLHIADKKLVTVEDLIGEIRTRMRDRGLPSHPPRRTARRKVHPLPCTFTRTLLSFIYSV